LVLRSVTELAPEVLKLVMFELLLRARNV